MVILLKYQMINYKILHISNLNYIPKHYIITL